MYQPVFLPGFPAIVWAGCVYGSQRMWLSLLGTTQSQVYSAPPLSFSVQTVGLTHVSALLGSISGMIYGGYFVDYLTIKLFEFNNSIMEPEHRLRAVVLATITNGVGLFPYIIGATSGTHWFVSVGLGQFFIGFTMSSSGRICLTYGVNGYPNLASDAIVLFCWFATCLFVDLRL